MQEDFLSIHSQWLPQNPELSLALKGHWKFLWSRDRCTTLSRDSFLKFSALLVPCLTSHMCLIYLGQVCSLEVSRQTTKHLCSLIYCRLGLFPHFSPVMTLLTHSLIIHNFLPFLSFHYLWAQYWKFTKYLIHWQFYRNLCILAYPLHNYFDSFWLKMNINVQLSPSLIMRKLPIRKFQLLETPGRRKEKRSLWVWWFGFFNVLFCTVLKGHMKFKCKYFGHISIMYSVCHLNRM